MKINKLSTVFGIVFLSILTFGMFSVPIYTNKVTNNSVGTEEYEGTGPSSTYDYENMSGIVEDAENKANNGNTSIYILQRSGVFITVQYLFSIFNILQINPEKEIYILNNLETSEHSSIKDINGQYLEDTYPNIEYKVVDGIQTPTDDEIMENAPTSNDIDLYLDSQSTIEYQQNLIVDLEDLGINLNSITFATDGIGTGMNNPTPKTQKYYMENNIYFQDIVNFNVKGKNLFENGVLPTTEEITFMNKTVFSNTNIDEDPENEFQYGGVSYDQFISGNLINVTNEIPIDLESAWNTLTIEKKEEFKYVYNVDYLIKPILDQTNGYENIVYSGIGMMNDTEAKINYEVNVLKKVIDEYEIGTKDETKLLYKPHPKEEMENIKKVWQQLQIHLGQAPTEETPWWFVIIPQQIPLEILGLAHIFEENESTSYKYILSGTSTAVAAGGSAGISDDIEFITIPEFNSSFNYFPEENLYFNLYGIYGEESQVYNGDIVVEIKSDGTLFGPNGKPTSFEGSLFHAIFWPTLGVAISGFVGFYFYRRSKRTIKE